MEFDGYEGFFDHLKRHVGSRGGCTNCENNHDELQSVKCLCVYGVDLRKEYCIYEVGCSI